MTFGVGLAVLWLGVVLLVAEAMRRNRWDGELIRKFVHIAVGNIILLAWGFAYPLEVCLAFCIPFMGVTLLSYRLPILQSINSIGRRSLGTFYYAVSFTVLIGFFWPRAQPEFAVLGILIMTWGDALAALVGKGWGRRFYTIGTIQKTWEGTAVMALVSTLVSGCVLSVRYGWQGAWIGVALGVGLVAAILEIFSEGGIDNITVPVGSGLLAWWWVGRLL